MRLFFREEGSASGGGEDHWTGLEARLRETFVGVYNGVRAGALYGEKWNRTAKHGLLGVAHVNDGTGGFS